MNMEENKKFAIIDLGSSTIKLNVCEFDAHQEVATLLKKSLTTNLAEDFFENEMIKDEARKRTMEGLKELKNEALDFGVTDFKLIGTKVLRDAKNSNDILSEIEKETGLKLEVLSKENEASYVANAVFESFEEKEKDMVVINAGGGSTEIVLRFKGNVDVFSLPIGISDLNEKFVKEYPIDDGKYNEMKEFIKKNVFENIKDILKFKTMVYTGGELEYMLITGFPLQDFEGSFSHPKQLNKENFDKYASKMREMSLEKIQSFMPENPGWMSGAIASNTLLEVLSDVFEVEIIIPSNKNVNDGILLEMM